jgi:hypothetical protein
MARTTIEAPIAASDWRFATSIRALARSLMFVIQPRSCAAKTTMATLIQSIGLRKTWRLTVWRYWRKCWKPKMAASIDRRSKQIDVPST